jgi:sulfonate transport system substrate-binding protein
MTSIAPQPSARTGPGRPLWLAVTVLAFLMIGATVALAQEKVVRIGYQKYGTLVLLKGKGLLEPKLKELGYRVAWAEFPAGPQLLEALNAGAIDLGSTGEAPPIFAQAAAGARLTYVAHEPPAPLGEAILVPRDSAVKTVADLKGKKVALNKGSNVHYLLVRALEQAGVAYADIQPVFLAPADARAAFERGAVDAWAIWDPFQAAAEAATGARTLANGTGLVANHQFYLADRAFTEAHPRALDAVLDGIAAIDAWAKDNTDAVAAELAPSVGIPAPVLAVALRRQTYGVRPLDAAVVAEQQRIADTFHKLGVLPKPITVGDAVRRTGPEREVLGRPG